MKYSIIFVYNETPALNYVHGTWIQDITGSIKSAMELADHYSLRGLATQDRLISAGNRYT